MGFGAGCTPNTQTKAHAPLKAVSAHSAGLPQVDQRPQGDFPSLSRPTDGRVKVFSRGRKTAEADGSSGGACKPQSPSQRPPRRKVTLLKKCTAVRLGLVSSVKPPSPRLLVALGKDAAVLCHLLGSPARMWGAGTPHKLLCCAHRAMLHPHLTEGNIHLPHYPS